MFDSVFLTIIPPIIASVLAYLVANKRAKIQYANTVAGIQYKAIQIVSEAEKKLRDEIRSELVKVREENEKLRDEILTLKHRLETSNELITTLRAEIVSLKSLVDNYKEKEQLLKNKNTPA